MEKGNGGRLFLEYPDRDLVVFALYPFIPNTSFIPTAMVSTILFIVILLYPYSSERETIKNLHFFAG